MTSMPCRNAALDRVITPWVMKIAAFLGIIVETILTIACNIRSTTLEPRAFHHNSGRQLPAPRPGLSRSTTSEFDFLPPSTNALARIRAGHAVRQALGTRALVTIMVQLEHHDVMEASGRHVPT